MKVINRSLRTLSRQLDAADKAEDSYKAVLQAQSGCVAARGLVPKGPGFDDADKAKQAKALEPYRRHLIELNRKMLDLETAMLDGKADVAHKLMDDINKLKDSAHKELGVKDNDEHR